LRKRGAICSPEFKEKVTGGPLDGTAGSYKEGEILRLGKEQVRLNKTAKWLGNLKDKAVVDILKVQSREGVKSHRGFRAAMQND